MGGSSISRKKYIIVFLGPAGSGKTTLTGSYGNWLKEKTGISVGFVNLDPGTETLCYSADFDIRGLITVRDIMVKEGLGPNGAFIKCMDLMLQNKEIILNSIRKIEKEYVLIDTPGQMEVFVFRKAGPELISTLKELGPVICVLIFDPIMADSPSSLVAMMLLSLVVQLRLEVDNVVVLNKVDAIEDKSLLDLVENRENLKSILASSSEGLVSDMALSLIDIIGEYTSASRLVKISALKKIGFEELYDILHEIFCVCGDLT